MRLSWPFAAGVLGAFLLGASLAVAAPREGDAYHIVLARRALGPGEAIELRLVPPPPEGARVNYGMRIGALGIGFPDGVYRAPYVIPVGTPPVEVFASFSANGFRFSATTEIELLPGSMPGAGDCLGPGQAFSANMGGIEPDYTYLDVLPTLVHAAAPEYPRSSFVRGVEDTVPVRALVCRTGRVLDAVALPSYRGMPGANAVPVERDPKIVEAALAAVRQNVFSPGLVAGQPAAVWVHVGVSFRR